jgi:hypothetical protein
MLTSSEHYRAGSPCLPRDVHVTWGAGRGAGGRCVPIQFNRFPPGFLEGTTAVGAVLTGCVLRPGMGRAQRRAELREEAKRERTSELAAREPRVEAAHHVAGEHVETPEETARRIYRTGGESELSPKKRRRAIEKPLKWREGRQ